MKFKISIFLLAISLSIVTGEILSQWRGPTRDGIYPAKNLLKEWPADGPRMIWSYEGLGKGHGTVAVAHDKIYVAGMPDSIGILYAFDMTGNLLWKKAYGLEWTGDYPGSRSTATIVDNYLYFESGRGVVFCLDATTGTEIWSVDLLKTFNAKNIQWGMAESILIDGEKVICTPGGPEHNVVALNRFTGETIWTTKGWGEPAAYCSPILFNHYGRRLIVTMTAGSIIGIDADKGKTLWRIQQDQGNKIHANTPVYFEGKVLCAGSSSRSEHHGLVLLDLSKDGSQARVLWRNMQYTNLMGGILKKDNFIYGAKYRRNEWYCINLNNGEIQYINKVFDGGAIVEADNLFYCYSEKGELALVDANSKNFKVISKFEVPLGTDQHWAHPVIKDGRMYIRHGNALMVYDIAEKK